MDITQCILAKDEYIIQKVQPEIVKSVKVELIQIGHEKMHHKVCLIPGDKDEKLLKPKS